MKQDKRKEPSGLITDEEILEMKDKIEKALKKGGLDEDEMDYLRTVLYYLNYSLRK